MNAIRSPAAWFLWFSCALLPMAVLAQSATPMITGCRLEGTNVVVTAQIPAGLRSITLEGSDRLGRLGWVPRAVTNLETGGGSVSLRVPMARSMEVIRVRASASQPLPEAFFQGTNVFSAPSDNSTGLAPGGLAGNSGDGAPPGNGPTSTRAVVESDIWQVQGTKLYFFNQYRGLQIIDISNPDAAFIRGTLALPAAGDQMYLLGSNSVVLLARDGCDYNQSQVLVVGVTNDSPSVVAKLPISGTISESRLVGTALYVASETFRPFGGTNTSSWEWGTLLSSFDLSNPGMPVARDTLWFSGYGDVVSATDTYLFIGTQSATNWWQTVVNLVDITDPAGKISAYGSITTAGQVLDKFKLNYSGTVFTAISEDWHWSGGTQVVTRLETFSLPDPRSVGPQGIVKLGEVDFGQGERLHATRFDSNRLYAVTFFQIDPLWVVDLSNPQAPRISGSVTVPGWSTYIEPLGNRLVTMGIESNHVAVSLFDVSDTASPSLLSRVRLGATYSWSEANYDEKAFTVLADAGLVLVPFSSDTTNGYASALQLIDYNTNSLVARGLVQSDSGLSYRRATVVGSRILSLSDWELVSVNATDRDNPLITAQLMLAPTVDRVFVSGQYLIELSGGNSLNLSPAGIAVAGLGAPDVALARLDLMPLQLLGATINNDRLYVAQGTPNWSNGGSLSNAASFGWTVLSLTNLPSLPVISQSVTNTSPLGWSTDWQALWPKPDVLVWAGGQDWWWWCQFCGWPAGPSPVNGPVGTASTIWWPFWRGSGGNGHLVALDARNPDSPVLASEVDLTDTNRWGFSSVILANNLVYLSHQTTQFVPPINPTNSGSWVFRSFLDVVDFADPADPLVRDPVNIPNQLVGVDNSGALLFSVGTHWNADPSAPWREYLDASAYDGVSAHLVDSLPLSAQWPHPVLVLNTNVLVANPGDNATTNPVAPALASWTLSSTGRFVNLGSITLTAPASDLVAFPGLVATTAWDSTVNLFDPSDLAALRVIGSGKSSLCWWWPDLHHADGSPAVGLWIPLGPYGVFSIRPYP
jgi:hypothetical protein